MNKNYEEVPNIISTKDLDYLTDMFGWNYGAYKKLITDIDFIIDSDIKRTLKKASKLFYKHMEDTLNIMKNGGKNE